MNCYVFSKLLAKGFHKTKAGTVFYIKTLLFSSSLPQSLSSVVFCIPHYYELSAVLPSSGEFFYIFFGYHMWDLYLSFEPYVVWAFLLCEWLSVCSAPTCGSCICPLSPTLFGRSYFVNDCQYVRLPHVGVVFVLWALRCLDVPTLWMTVSMFDSHMWELYLSFEPYVVWTFLLCEWLSVCSATTCGSCICPLSPTLSGRSYFVNDCQYVRLPHVGVVFVLWALRCLDVPTLWMTVSMFGSHMWELYFSFEYYFVRTFLLHQSSYILSLVRNLVEVGRWVHYCASCSLRYALVYPHSFVHLSC